MTQISFNGRCPQIRDAQWVSHTVNTELPHFSTTKFKPIFKKFVTKTLKPQKEPQSLFDVIMLIEPLERYKNNSNNFTFKQKVAKYISDFRLFFNKEAKRNMDILLAIMNKVQTFGEKRQNWGLLQENVDIMQQLGFMKFEKLGNCDENSRIAELILKMNGIKHTATAQLCTKTKLIDHVVCIFNKDDSIFDENITNKTIIIDPWAGIADFAKNTIVTYKNMYNIPKNQKLEFTKLSELESSQVELNIYKELYPELVFKNKQRKFMEDLRQK